MTTGDDQSKAYYKANAAEKMREWRAANPRTPEQKAKAAEKSREWQQENKQHYEAYMKAWREANHEQLSAKHIIYNKTRRQRAALKSEAGD